MRNIYIVTATQVVTSEAHPEGLQSAFGETKIFDSRGCPAQDGNPNGDSDKALAAAKAEFWTTVNTLYTTANANRVMWAVTITRHDGAQIERQAWGQMPDMTPVTEPAPAEPTKEE